MTTDPQPPAGDGPRYPWLERATAAVLALVLLALGWMAVAACCPEWDWRLSLDAQVGLVVALLTAALGMVSLVALLHTHA
jgi:hypothetical protein